MEQPLRLEGIDPERAYAAKEIKSLKDEAKRSETAPPVIRKVHKSNVDPDPLRGLFPATIKGKSAVVEYEPDPDLRDTEQVPLLEEGGIDEFLRHEVLPYAPDAWYVPDSVKVGYEISFTRHFYKPQPLPMDFFPEAVQAYIEDGEYRSDHPCWHPIISKTIVREFSRPEHRRPRIPRAYVAAITKSDFENICGFAVDDSNPILKEDGWFIDETESFLGVVVWHKADQDWGYVILARDEHFQFRAIDSAASMPERALARGELQLAIMKLVVEGQRIF